MKFMKLGNKPDLFQADGNSVRYVTSELPADTVVNVEEVRFYLHKFPLLSKSIRLQKLVLKAPEGSSDEIHLYDFPGGSKAFEICAKFCYGMTVILNAYNIVAARCAAEYLEMNEDAEKGNLIFKIEVFLNSCVFASWKDSIIVLQSTKVLLPWSDDLNIVGRCIDSIASKTSVDPSTVNWSYTYSMKRAMPNEIVDQDIKLHQKNQAFVPKDWWIEDISDLDIDHYKRVMTAIKSKGRMSAGIIEEALMHYAIRWLPNSISFLVSDESLRRNRTLVETIICLMPSDKYSVCSCSFLLKLLKFVMLIGDEDPVKEELLNRIGLQLDKASMQDLLIPARQPSDTIYDVHLVQSLVSQFVMRANKDGSNCVDKIEKFEDGYTSEHASLLAVGKLVDGYLTEVASDPNLSLSSFIDLAQSIPVTGRPVHDELYTAVDIYLQEHPDLVKAEKKKICSIINVKKLSSDACIHAAQNERLPLRMVVQVLFFEQLRAAASWATAVESNGDLHGSFRAVTNVEDFEGPGPEHCKSLNKQVKSAHVAEDECPRAEDKKTCNSNKSRVGLLLPSKSKRIFEKLWTGKVKGDNNRSSETSGSSQSPPTSVNPRDIRSSCSTSRNRRHSVS